MALSPGPYEDSLGSTAVLSIKEFSDIQFAALLVSHTLLVHTYPAEIPEMRGLKLLINP